MSSAAPKKKSFDRGGPVWPPRSNVTNDRLRWGSGGALPPQPKFGGSGGQRPPAKTENFSKFFEKKFETKNQFTKYTVITLMFHHELSPNVELKLELN